MKNTILSALIILAYFFAVSCEDVINSDDNVYKNPINEKDSLNFDLYYATLTDQYQIFKYDILKNEKTIWKENSLFLNKSIDNQLLYFTINNNIDNKNYHIYNFNDNVDFNFFSGNIVNNYFRLINNNQLLESKTIKYDESNSIVYLSTDLTNNTKRVALGFDINSIHPSPNNLHFSSWSNLYSKPIHLTNLLQSTDFELSDNTYPYEWINEDEIICFNHNSILNEKVNNFLIKYNIHSNQTDTIITSDNLNLSFPKLSPDKQKIAFTMIPDGVGIVNIDGSNLKVLREPSNLIITEMKSFNEWSPDGRFLINRRFYANSSSSFYNSGLELINIQSGNVINIESNNNVVGATFINK